MFPAIIPDRLVHEFKFWDNGAVYRGMRCSMELYRCVATFPLDQAQQAYSLGTTLCEQNHQTALTKSNVGYTVWLSLRSVEANSDKLSPELFATVGAA